MPEPVVIGVRLALPGLPDSESEIVALTAVESGGLTVIVPVAVPPSATVPGVTESASADPPGSTVNVATREMPPYDAVTRTLFGD